MKRPSLLVVVVLALVVAGVAFGQFRGRRSAGYGTFDDNHPPATEFVNMRWHFGTNGAIGHMGYFRENAAPLWESALRWLDTTRNSRS